MDPIGPEFYVPLRNAEILSAVAFYLAGALSISVLLLDKSVYPYLYEVAQATFSASVIAYFCFGIVIRMYFATRAHSGRVADFVSNAFSVPLIPNPSKGYYNAEGQDPFMRMGAALLENALFTKSILRRMLRWERLRSGIYVIGWLWASIYRATDLEILAIAAQVLFSEQLLSRWLRMEWLRGRVERIYDDAYALLQSTSNIESKEFRARVVEGLIRYETSKAQAAISLSSRVFSKMNAALSEQWRTLSNQLGLASPGKRDGV